MFGKGLEPDGWSVWEHPSAVALKSLGGQEICCDCGSGSEFGWCSHSRSVLLFLGKGGLGVRPPGCGRVDGSCEPGKSKLNSAIISAVTMDGQVLQVGSIDLSASWVTSIYRVVFASRRRV